VTSETTYRVQWFHGGNLAVFAQCAKDSPKDCDDLATLDLASGKLHNFTVNWRTKSPADQKIPPLWHTI